MFSNRTIQNLLGAVHRLERTVGVSLTQLVQGGLFESSFIEEPAADVGVVIGAVESLLKAPVESRCRRGSSFHALELLESGVDAGIGSQRTAPVSLQRQQALC